MNKGIAVFLVTAGSVYLGAKVQASASVQTWVAANPTAADFVLPAIAGAAALLIHKFV